MNKKRHRFLPVFEPSHVEVVLERENGLIFYL